MKKAQQAYNLAKDDRSRILIQAKQARDVAAEQSKAELDALKKLDASLRQVTPAVTDSLLSVARRYMTHLPVIGDKLTPFLTPKFWGDIALSKGLKAATPVAASGGANMAAIGNQSLWILANIIAHSSQNSSKPNGK